MSDKVVMVFGYLFIAIIIIGSTIAAVDGMIASIRKIIIGKMCDSELVEFFDKADAEMESRGIHKRRRDYE